MLRTYIACHTFNQKNRLTSHFLLLHHHTSSPAHFTSATLQHCGLLGYTAVRSGTRQTAEHAASLFRVRTDILGKWLPVKHKWPLTTHDPHITVHSPRASLPLLTPSSSSSDISTTLYFLHSNQINSLLVRTRTRILSQTLITDHTASSTGTPR
jgi:hypothetical protein